MPIFRKINADFFKNWTYTMAYVLGFIYADGNVVHTKRNTWFWSVQVTDKEVVDKIKLACESSHKINERKAVGKNKKLYRIQIGSKTMCQDLISLGVIERKSKVIGFPEVPSRYFSDFLRGYFDGDGGVWLGFKNKKTNRKNHVINTYFTSGSRDFLSKLQICLRSRGLKGGSLVKKERGFDLKYSINDSFHLYKIMYTKRVSSLFLKRKRDRFEKYIKIRGRSSAG